MNKAELEQRVEELEVENARLRAEGRQLFDALQTRENLVASLTDLDLYRRRDISSFEERAQEHAHEHAAESVVTSGESGNHGTG